MWQSTNVEEVDRRVQEFEQGTHHFLRHPSILLVGTKIKLIRASNKELDKIWRKGNIAFINFDYPKRQNALSYNFTNKCLANICWEKRVIFPLKQNPNRATRQIILNK